MAGRASFSKIIGVVGRKKTHRISSRAGNLRDRRLKRLKDIGVRSHSRNDGLISEIPREHRAVYNAAYQALKASNKSWATESEVKAILYGDKEMSRERSGEVIEILRKAQIAGFKETDEVTSGDAYSERVLNVLDRRSKSKLREQREATIKKVMSKDKRSIGTMNIDPQGDSAEPNSFSPGKIVSLQTSQSRPDMYGGRKKKDEKRLFSAEEIESMHDDYEKKQQAAKAHKGAVLERERKAKEKKKQSASAQASGSKKKDGEDEELEEVPLRYDLDDFI